jgi:hypothetical protein
MGYAPFNLLLRAGHNWHLFQGEFSLPGFGTIREIIMAKSSKSGEELTYVMVQCFDLGAEKHTVLDMPSASRSARHLVIQPSVCHICIGVQNTILIKGILGHSRCGKLAT